MSEFSYIQISSSVNPSFWSKLSELKLNVYKLDESPRSIWGLYTIPNNSKLTFIEVDSTSFNIDFNYGIQNLPFHGKLYNMNYLEQFKECDKILLLNNEGKMLYQKFKDNSILKDPTMMNCFIIISFADLKKYHYFYWFAYPVLKDLHIEIISSHPILDLFSEGQVASIFQGYKQLEYNQRSHFLMISNNGVLEIYSLSSKINDIKLNNIEEVYFVFYNISYDSSKLGSQLRNYVAFILHYCPFLENQIVNILALSLTRRDYMIGFWESYVHKFKLPVCSEKVFDMWVGWEPNEKNKMCPRFSNMRNSLDPLSIAEDAVDLNLKLMKWNVLPNVNLDKIKNTTFLLLGSGTLGCSVARTLLGWGVRNISFVDNSNVSFSNPVRQSLFTYSDSVKSKPKAQAAAENLKLIFPGVNSRGIHLNINMPGHPVGESMMEQTLENLNELTDLIKQHDVIFILMDSRESRWLPTLLGSYYKKIVINAALGFDTFLVMRHGVMVDGSIQKSVENRIDGIKCINGFDLGCYFCNDVTAPGNSIKGRSLDQQCTVTRPGVSQIAGALAAELSISILQHSNVNEAPAFYGVSEENSLQNMEFSGSVLGLVPHSIRGFLHSFEQILPATEKYTNCVACSKMVLKDYQEHGIDFLLKVFNSSKHLEDVALLTKMFGETNFNDVLEFSDEDF